MQQVVAADAVQGVQRLGTDAAAVPLPAAAVSTAAVRAAAGGSLSAVGLEEPKEVPEVQKPTPSGVRLRYESLAAIRFYAPAVSAERL